MKSNFASSTDIYLFINNIYIYMYLEGKGFPNFKETLDSCIGWFYID